MKILIKSILVIAIFIQLNVSVLAETNGFGAGLGRTDSVNINDYSTSSYDRFNFNYKFETGIDYKYELGKPTGTEIVPRNIETENMRRNKDVSFKPPVYGIFSGQFDTARSNPYIQVLDSNYVRDTGTSIDNPSYDTLMLGVNEIERGVLPTTSIIGETEQTTSTNNNYVEYSNNISNNNNNYSVISYSDTLTNNKITTLPWYNSDGSIGKIRISAVGINVKVYEGETLENMKKGAGHFENTSSWEGNVGIASHNRGSAGYFQGLKDVILGDRITYETGYGTKTYEVIIKTIISDNDFSYLSYTSDNRITLLTCVENSSSERLVVQGIEVK